MYICLISSIFIVFSIFTGIYSQFNDICGITNGRRFYVEHGESGNLLADFRNNVLEKVNRSTTTYNKCTVEFITCPSCVVEIRFRYLNISRNCGKASVLDTCGCDYVWIYEPPIEDASGEQFCGRFIQSNASTLSYVSQTRTVAVSFIYNNEYGLAFTLDYFTKRNTINVNGYPRIGNMNNASQFISSPFFPYFYPTDLSVEYIINCKSLDTCRINLLFTDFLIDKSSIIEFFDWNGQRMQVISGNVFRPSAITSNGPSLTIRFYANGASGFGFKATYSFILGDLDDFVFKPNIGCGGNVNNLGGGITMMNMVKEGTKLFDCVWIVKPPDNLLHRKTHLYVKVATFLDFAGTTELIIRQGVTSNQPTVEVLRHPAAHYSSSKQVEHVVPVSTGFYISLRGIFTSDSRLAIVYAAFNYKGNVILHYTYTVTWSLQCATYGNFFYYLHNQNTNIAKSWCMFDNHIGCTQNGFNSNSIRDCFGNSEFLCNNFRCIPLLLNCDGFDHCGDNSDESNCSQDPKDHREFSKIPNFLFPKTESYSNMTTATFIFLTCSFGLIGIILAMALLLYRVNVRAQHQRQLQDHIETIHAILEEGVRDIQEEVIVPDDPPDYDPPPEYDDLLKLKCLKHIKEFKHNHKSSSERSLLNADEISRKTRSASDLRELTANDALDGSCRSITCSSRSCRTIVRIPDSPPPAYENVKSYNLECRQLLNLEFSQNFSEIENSLPGTSISIRNIPSQVVSSISRREFGERPSRHLEHFPICSPQLFSGIGRSFRNFKSVNLLRNARHNMSCSDENLVKYFSDSELIFNPKMNIHKWCAITNRLRLKKSFSTDDLSLL